MDFEKLQIEHNCNYPERYTKEFKMLKQRLYYKFYPLKTFFPTKEVIDAAECEQRSKGYKDLMYGIKKSAFKDRLLDELLYVECKVSDGKKVKYYTEQILSDDAIDAIRIYYRIIKYHDCLKEIKDKKDCGLKHFMALEHGDEYKSAQEFRNIIIVSDIIKNAYELLTHTPLNKQTNEFLRQSIIKLQEYVPLTTRYYDYGISKTEFVDGFENFSKEEVYELQKLNNDILQQMIESYYEDTDNIQK